MVLISLAAVATDAVGNVATSSSVSVMVNNSLPINVFLGPATISLSGGQLQQFAATVTGGPGNTAVSVELEPQRGDHQQCRPVHGSCDDQRSANCSRDGHQRGDPTKSATTTITLLAPVNVSLGPAAASLSGGQLQQFAATVTGGPGNTAVTWSLSPNVGTISNAGLYTAPATISALQTVTVTAASVADPTKSATATITLLTPVNVSLGPATTSLSGGQLQQFAASVTGGPGNTAVTWSLGPNLGTISNAGLYAAPATISAQQTVAVTATSVADPTKSATASIALLPISVVTTPTAVYLGESQSLQFVATVSHSNNAGVVWSLSSPVGNISSAGLYTAPDTITSAQLLTVTATSVADPNASAAVTLTLLPAFTAASPAAVSLGASQSQQFLAITTAPFWSVTPPIGSISSTGLYTAPAQINALQVVTITATSSDSTPPAGAIITLLPASGELGPAAVSLAGSQTQKFLYLDSDQVSWSLTPPVGSISSDGMYSAPGTISSRQVVTVTCTSITDGSTKAMATITLLPPVGVSVNPSVVNLYGSQTQPFTAVVSNTSNTAVIWSLSPNVGTINDAGLYTAPATISAQQTVAMTATSVVDPSKSATATITLLAPVNVFLGPATISLSGGQLQQFAATVTGGPGNTAVTWSLSPNVGTINNAGLYTAPATTSAQQTVAVTATSVVDPTKSATTTITLLAPVNVSLGPATTSLSGGQLQQFAATVTGGPGNTAVTWSLSPNVGTISNAGLYTAPATISALQTVTVTAASVADPTKSATATITLLTPVNVSLGPATTSLSGGQLQQFAASVTGGPGNTAVTWSLGPNLGTISNAGLYAAPATISAQQTVAVTATSVADPTKSATASIALLPISVVTTPTAVYLGESQSLQFVATVSHSNNAGVVWSLSSPVGNISSAGLYTAPDTITSAQLLTVTATSVADPNASAAVTLTLLPAFTAASPAAVSLGASQSQQFLAITTAPFWSVTPPIGSISSTGLYTAPAQINALQVVTITATSSDSTPPAGAIITLLPASGELGPAAVSLAGSQTQKFLYLDSDQVSWSLTPPVGSISSDGMYSAPGTISSRQVVTVTCTSITDGSTKAMATITLLPPVGVSVNPSVVNLYGSQTQPFTAVVSNTSNTAVIWSLSPNVGTINDAGLYTAPATISAQQTVAVTATSVVDPSKSATATITLLAPVNVFLGPATISLSGGQLQQFAATVTGGPGNTAVTWSLSPNLGTISNAGLYTAPATISALQTVTVTAASVADPTKSATATITLLAPVNVSLGPAAASLSGGQTQQFAATVTGGPGNTAVTWSLSPNVGTINNAGLYTAPATISALQTVTVTAASVVDPTKSATATITLLAPVNVSLGPAAASLSGGQTQQFAATVTGGPGNTAVTWSLSPNVGTINNAGLYTAPATTSAQQTVAVTATSVVDPTKSATTTITLLAPVNVSLGPATTSLSGGQSQQFAATVTGGPGNTAVTWSLSPNVGTISNAGLYTAPATISAQQTVAVTATSVADPTEIGHCHDHPAGPGKRLAGSGHNLALRRTVAPVRRHSYRRPRQHGGDLELEPQPGDHQQCRPVHGAC